jgi:hypothetical protein
MWTSTIMSLARGGTISPEAVFNSDVYGQLFLCGFQKVLFGVWYTQSDSKQNAGGRSLWSMNKNTL